MIKAIIFDYGGVVGKPEMMHVIYKATEKEFGIKAARVQKAFESIETPVSTGKLSMNEFWKLLAKKLGIKDIKKLKKVWTETFNKKIRKNEKVVQLVNKLKKRYIVALFSNVIPSHQRYHELHKDYKIFPKVFLSTKIKLRKPYTRAYKYVLRELKVRPEECVLIDDKTRNVIAAKKVGIKAILFKNATQLEKELKKYL